MLLQEMSIIKIELTSLKQNFANTPSSSKPHCHHTHLSLPHTLARPQRSTQHYLSVFNLSINSHCNHSWQTSPGPLILFCQDGMISIMVNAFIIIDIPLMADVALQVALIIKHLKSL